MFATDDRHPNDILSEGHIDCIVKKAIAAGVDPIIALKVASHHAARYFLMNNKGAIAPGYLADLIVVDDLDRFKVLKINSLRRGLPNEMKICLLKRQDSSLKPHEKEAIVIIKEFFGEHPLPDNI